MSSLAGDEDVMTFDLASHVQKNGLQASAPTQLNVQPDSKLVVIARPFGLSSTLKDVPVGTEVGHMIVELGILF